MLNNVYTFKIAGMAGQGIKSSGITFARFAGRSGYYIYNYIEYPSIIRGGHNVMQINISNEEITGPSNTTQLLLALNQEGIDFHLDELTEGAAILYDNEKNLDVSKVQSEVKLCGVPLSRFAKESGGNEILINTVGLGAAVGILNGDLNILNNFIREEYGDKGEEIVAADQKAAKLGYDYVRENYSGHSVNRLNPVESMNSLVPKMLVNGNEAAALGAISAGLQFASIYPMSPISNILHVLAKHQEEYGYVYKQPEDEISAINMTIGASFAGARSMTATSGGGFALMAEGYGLAGITETPIVIIEGMRGGPATGIPTWSSQGDLRFVLHAHQDDFPRIILTPGDAQETFYMTMNAFNIAEKYQTPVVVLIDKNICENDQTFQIFDTSNYKADRGKLTFEKVEGYQRFKLEDNGISLRTVPGVGNYFIANSDEHDEIGYSNEEIQNRNDQMKKRMTKLEVCAKEDMQAPRVYGPENADISFISWGSNKGAIIQALKYVDNVNFMHITWANPFPTEAVRNFIQNAKHVVNVECNYTAHMGGIIAENTGIRIQDNLLKYDGRPFYIEEIIQKVESIKKGGSQ